MHSIDYSCIHGMMQARDIDQETALKLVRSPEAAPDLLWRYLDYLVCQQGNAQPELHTELALQLAHAALHPPPPQQSAHQQPPSGMSPLVSAQCECQNVLCLLLS